MVDDVDVARKILHHIASCSPHVTNLGQPTERTCALCLTFIDEARAAFNYEPWPAIAHTPKAEPDKDSLMWLYTHCLAIGMSRGSESGKMAHDIALFTVEQQEQIKRTQHAEDAEKPEGMPLPWTSEVGHGYKSNIKDANGNTVTEVFSEFPGMADQIIASYIVSCVNQHQMSFERIKSLEATQRSMRRALAFAYGGALLYTDDGELQDNSRHPFIDWKRDEWDGIKNKLIRRNEKEIIKPEVKEDLAALRMFVDTFIVAALKEMGEEVFLLLPEQRLEKLKQIMLYIIKNKKTPPTETKIETDTWHPFPEHKPLVGDRVYFVRGGCLYTGWRRNGYFESERGHIYYDHNKKDVTHFMVHKLPQMPNDENTIKPHDMLLAAGYVQLPDGRWNYAPRPGFVPSAKALDHIKTNSVVNDENNNPIQRNENHHTLVQVLEDINKIASGYACDYEEEVEKLQAIAQVSQDAINKAKLKDTQ